MLQYITSIYFRTETASTGSFCGRKEEVLPLPQDAETSVLAGATDHTHVVIIPETDRSGRG
jgi:hypothetical protein